RHTRSKRDWSSDVCSSDLKANGTVVVHGYTNDQELGYEFWDTTFDQPMISETDKEAIVKRKPQTDFQTVKQYEEYQATMHDKEKIGRASCRERVKIKVEKT